MTARTELPELTDRDRQARLDTLDFIQAEIARIHKLIAQAANIRAGVCEVELHHPELALPDAFNVIDFKPLRDQLDAFGASVSQCRHKLQFPSSPRISAKAAA